MNEENITFAEKDDDTYPAINKTVSSKFFLIYIIALCTLSLVYLWEAVANIFTFGSISIGSKIFLNATRVSTYIYTRLGYCIIGIISILIFIVFTVSCIYAILCKKSSKIHPIVCIHNMANPHKLLSIISIFTCIDCAILVFGLFFMTIQDPSMAFLGNVFNFFRIKDLYELLGVAKISSSIPNTLLKLLLISFINIIIIAYAVAQVIMYKCLVNCFSSTVETLMNGVVREKQKTTLFMPFIFSGIYAIFAVFMFLNGSLIVGVKNIVLSAYVLLTVFFLKNINNNIFLYRLN